MSEYLCTKKKSQRIAAAVLSAVVLLAMLFSVIFMIEEAHHDCVGEDCPVCASIAACVKTFDSLADGAAKPKIPIALALFTAVAAITASTQIFSSETLISKKIRQNN